MLRTHTCGELSTAQLSQKVSLCGWVNRIRNKGKITWIDLRDRYGLTQIVFEKLDENKSLQKTLKAVGREFVLQVQGTVSKRNQPNPKLLTGAIEVIGETIKILNTSEVPPFTIEDDTNGGEDLRMQYRYLDMRRSCVKKNILFRHQLTRIVRHYLENQHFVDIETPCLIKSTPEGARDFLVPSRMNKGQYYALPQSPQTLKQILMVAGFDRYYQIVKCFRDEDLRADRQPEFTQLDCEMAFVSQEDIMKVFENLIKELFFQLKGIRIEQVQRMTYRKAMNSYGTDRPDLRFGCEIKTLTSIFEGTQFPPFQNANYIGAIAIPKAAEAYSRKKLDTLKKQYPGLTLVSAKYVGGNHWQSSAQKFLTKEQIEKVVQETQATEDALLLLMAGNTKQAQKALGEIRLQIAAEVGLIPENDFSVLWINEFPLFERDEETGMLHAVHHPFTAPMLEDMQKLSSEPENVRAYAHDMVINGVEVGGGSIRIHERSVQETIFKLLGLEKDEVEKQFGFLLNAFTYGAPPHGGIAFGIDRLCAILNHSQTIRDFIAFPKNTAGRDIMMQSPSVISQKQRQELGLKM